MLGGRFSGIDEAVRVYLLLCVYYYGGWLCKLGLGSLPCEESSGTSTALRLRGLSHMLEVSRYMHFCRGKITRQSHKRPAKLLIQIWCPDSRSHQELRSKTSFYILSQKGNPSHSTGASRTITLHRTGLLCRTIKQSQLTHPVGTHARIRLPPGYLLRILCVRGAGRWGSRSLRGFQ